ncbi:uncharacterized protein DEA37_0010143 [Paragonimus westermani]|uniref:Major facilitator superfamily (MFS) profile domain-containing protein n=1 Tax=Paragonimus westermani TaxID=34504 RepID=A0A5J4P2U8_9TREM|nr:uncharacterized protein DEA37_0010143 [Paragonimus westermani]
MGTYITAYLVQQNSSGTKNGMVLLTSLTVSSESVAMPLGGLMYRKVHVTFVTLLSCFLHCGAIALTYFSIQSGFVGLLITYGVLNGFGFGFGYSVLISCSAAWFPKHRGLVVGIVTGAFAAGGFVFTPIQTAYINPLNIKADNETR